MVHSISASQWVKAGLVAIAVAAWPTYALLTESRTPPTDPNAEVARHWRQVIEVNLERLRSGDPDLIYPGEVFDLPDPGPAA